MFKIYLQKTPQAALRRDITGLEAPNLSTKLIPTLQYNAKKCVETTIDVIGLHGGMLRTQKAAGCYPTKETLKMKTMDVTKEPQAPKVVQVKKQFDVICILVEST